MDFTNSFSVRAPLATVWEFLTDAERVTPCVPGAQLTETVDATHYKGTVKVKLGAVQMTYRGDMEMEPNEADHTIALRARGTEARGSGGASGTVTTRLTESQDGVTQVDIESHVDVTGRVAQFGRGIMQDVANRIIKEFAQCLEQKLQPEGTTGEEPAAPAPEPATASPTASSPPVSSAPPPTETPPPRPSAPVPPGGALGGTGPAGREPGGMAVGAARSKTAADPRAIAHDPPERPAPLQRTPPVPPGGASGGMDPGAVSLGKILLDVARARTARGLHILAELIEPD